MILTGNEALKTIQLLNNQNYQNLLRYLLYRHSEEPVYYSANALVELLSINPTRIYKMLEHIDKTGMRVQKIVSSTREETLDAISTKPLTDILEEELGFDIFEEEKTEAKMGERERSLFGLPDADTLFIQLPFHPFTDDPESGILDVLTINDCDIPDNRTTPLFNFLAKEANWRYFEVVLSGYIGITPQNLRYQYNKMKHSQYEELSKRLGYPPAYVTYKELRQLGLMKIDYDPSGIVFSPKVDTIHIEFKTTLPYKKPEFNKKNGLFIADVTT